MLSTLVLLLGTPLGLGRWAWVLWFRGAPLSLDAICGLVRALTVLQDQEVWLGRDPVFGKIGCQRGVYLRATRPYGGSGWGKIEPGSGARWHWACAWRQITVCVFMRTGQLPQASRTVKSRVGMLKNTG
eukprot:scaffold11412_cov72-Isochrysis_galbana.AAC.1